MNDISNLRASRAVLVATTALATAFASPAWAGDKVLYGALPAWVDEAPLDSEAIEDGPASLIVDSQHRLEDGVVTTYGDTATRIDNPQSLMEEGTISLSWYPDKGDLTIHRVEILREGERIDLIEQGNEFDILRRERGLEMRLLDGQLTATLAVPGLQVGDVLRVTHSMTLVDQALGDEMQASQYLGTKPWQVGFARTIFSWPEDEEVFWGAEDHAQIGEPVSANGEKRITVTLPLEELPEMPYDAPSRFNRHPVLRVGTFADWQELSRVMQPHYAAAAQVAPDSEVAAQARAIMERTGDPLERTALAVQLVQDEISYLLDGLDGGNYLPQDAADTWEKRYGDCKAKSVLLHTLLGEMGIESQVVLVQTSGGDAVPELLPIPGNFDHMIVRAMIDGTDYWLDGTSAATRIGNLAAVPPFHYALPLTPEGADLMAMDQRDPPEPNMEIVAVSDYSAGLDLPSLFNVSVRMYGPQGAQLRKFVDEADDDMLKKMAKGFGGSRTGGAVTAIEVDYDDAAAFGTITMKGVMGSQFSWDEGRMAIDPEVSPNTMFSADRAKPEWREIPVATQGPMRTRIEGEMVLPAWLSGFEYDGLAAMSDGFANTRYTTSTTLEGNRFVGRMDMIQQLGEVAPADLNEAKRAARRLASHAGKLIAPADTTWRWELEPAVLEKRIEPLVEAYTKAIDFAEEDDFGPLRQRANFYQSVYRFEDALADLDTLVEKDTSAATIQWRAQLYRSLGRYEDEIADYRRAYDLEPENYTAFTLAERLAYAGKAEEALALLEELFVSDEEGPVYASTYAVVAGLAGRYEDAEAALADELADKPNDASLLNGICWYRGLFDRIEEDTLDICTRAIERANNSAPMLDSRAMVHYRMGDFDASLADFDSALELNPGLAPSIYMRGMVLEAKGEKGGKDAVRTALRMAPELAETYGKHGIKPD